MRGPQFEKIAAPDGGSWRLFDRQLDALPFQWHYHPEFELTLTLNSRGRRYLGDHIATYDDGDLVLVGSNLPHTWHSHERVDESRPHRALVLWFTADWAERLIDICVELGEVRRLLDQARRGIAFSHPVAQAVRDRMLAMIGAPPAARLTGLLDVLIRLTGDDDRMVLAAPGPAARGMPPPPESGDGARIDRVLSNIHAHYRDGLRVRTLADLACVSTSSFHRLFKRHTGTTLTDYAIRLRIGQACALLASGNQPIAWIADAVGYHSLANFNRQFKALKGVTPRAFRRQFVI